MIVFHPVHVVPTEELGRICSNPVRILLLVLVCFFFNNHGYLFRNLTFCKFKNHHTLVKMEVSMFGRSPSSETADPLNYFVHVDFNNKD